MPRPGRGVRVVAAAGACALALAALGVVSCRTAGAPGPAPPPPAPEVEAPEAEPPPPVLVEAIPPLPPPPPPADLGREEGPLTVRIGLQTDQAAVGFPCCQGTLSAVWEGRTVATAEALTVEPAAEAADPGVFRLQVAALRDPEQAATLAARLERATGLPVVSGIDAESGLFKVRVGRFARREEAEAAKRRLASHGVAESFVVGEGGGLRAPALLLRQGAERQRLPGRWLAIAGAEGVVPLGDRRYRGRILVFLNDRGTLNVINETLLDDYVRGVVPREMGPEVYPEIEALKAQAVAARTYTLRNLGEFTSEGFDICATPRCQVYGGVSAEHPLSDRAVAETAGQVLLWHGEPVDALYSSTCGGHTEDVGTVFPLKRGLPYLEGVPCVEQGVSTVPGAAAGAFPAAVNAALLGGAGDGSAASLASRLAALAALAGLASPPASLAGLEAPEVRRHVARLLDLALDARLFVAGADLPYLLASPPPEWSDEDRRLAALFVKLELGDGEERRLSLDEQELLVYRLAEYLRLVEPEEVRFLAISDGRLLVRRRGGERREVELPPGVLTFRRLGDGPHRAGPLSLVPGDRLQLVAAGERLLAVVQRVEREGVANDRGSAWSSWSRFKSDRELAAAVGERFPGFAFRSFEVLERGVSGRVGRLRLLGAGGESELVEGLAVRWTLDLPDTLFTARRLAPAGGEAGWLFTGKGWGHGVGLCQIGSYGMALRGHGYREILAHYYRGVDLGRVVSRATQRQGADAPAR